MNGLALCAGVGGLELGIGLAFGGHRAVCYVEREAHASAILVARMAEGRLAPAPVWDDLGRFDGRPWRGVVDCVSAGFPCQPWSVAGKRAGTADERWLWPEIERIVGDVGPALVFLENVPGLLGGGLGHVLGGLASLGYDAEWGCFPASAVGAPHERERVYVFAYTGLQYVHAIQRRAWDEPAGDGVQGLFADADGKGRQGGVAQGSQAAGDKEPRWFGAPLETFPYVRRGDDGLAERVDRLRACGNGVVPLAAAYAFRALAARALNGKT